MKRRSIASCLVVGFLVTTAACVPAAEHDEASGEGQSDLKTSAHRDISRDACRAQGLPAAFCARVGSEAFNVDVREWTDLTAHSQQRDGESSCEAATAVAARLTTLGMEIRSALLAQDGDQAESIAVALGRALHTLEDNCAHHGMSNPQHASYSREAQCHREIDPAIFGDPDEKEEATACAANEAKHALAAFMSAVRAADYPIEALEKVDAIAEQNPTLSQACSFIREYSKWDGVDTSWNNAATVPAFREVLASTMTRGTSSTNVCRNLKNPRPLPGKATSQNPACFVCGT